MTDTKNERHTVTLGFQGGGGLVMKLTDDAAQKLLDALGRGDWHEVDDVEGTVTINLAQVVYVRTERAEHRVGFGR
ncbi:MAG: hypothetical protein LT070_12040 [Solirubrobacteraceae bacterium]|nr:hypothetical protein [Solirubrobacteraceae bacterium]